MRRTPVLLVLLAAVDLGLLAHAAGSRVSGFALGSLREVCGRVTEYAVPTPQYAHAPAAVPDGSVWITVMPRSNTGVRTMSLDAGSRLWYVGSHNGKLGVLEKVDLPRRAPARAGTRPAPENRRPSWISGSSDGWRS